MVSFIRRNHAPRWAALAWIGLATATPAICGPHEHGVIHMDIVVEGKRLQVAVMAPLESLLGYERAPRDGAEKAAAASLLEQLRSAATVIELNDQAQCKAGAPVITAPMLEGKVPAKAMHADLKAEYAFECTSPERLQTAQINLFGVSKRISRVQVQLAGPNGQSQSTLRRNKRQLKLIK